jgi:hypothetical protein
VLKLDCEDSLLDDFKRRFVRSRRGNLWREHNGLAVTIFKCAGGYGYCIADEDGPLFSSDRFDTETEAIEGIRYELGL